MVDNRNCYWYYQEGEEHQCYFPENKINPCYIHVDCYYYIDINDTDNYIRKLIKENEQLKLEKIE